MAAYSTPSEVAREAIRQLAVRRLPPTPENYRLLYEEIGGPPAARDAVGAEREVAPYLREQISKVLTDAVVPRLGYNEQLASEARSIAQAFREARSLQALQEQAVALRKFWIKLELRGETVSEVLHRSMSLLQLVVRNFDDLAGEGHGVESQLGKLESLLGAPPGVKSLQDVERLLRDIIWRRRQVHQGIEDAKTSMKHLITLFLDRLTLLSASTDGYSERIGEYAREIESATDISQLSGVVSRLMADTRSIQVDVARSGEELDEARRSVQEYEARVSRLERELKTAASLVREDPLTGTLNRRGLEEAFNAEMSRAKRSSHPMSLAVLDVDNFKHLNDRLGHQAGDAALSYLARILRTTLRPSDIIARFGGEEFVILLPETMRDEAVQVMTRVQRELTRRFFLHENEKVLITFSAGVAECSEGESRDSLIGRADQAMYEAKQTGKNRVCVAKEPAPGVPASPGLVAVPPARARAA